MKSLKLSTLEGYHHLLTSDTTGSRSEWKELAALLTTGETYFFRDRGQFSLLRNFILPAIIEKKRPTQTLRIWSAGCSSGEEAYSTAILLNEILSKLKAWDIYVLGTDINEQAVEKAKKGIYSQWSFRMTDPDLRKRYFKNRADDWELDEKIRKMVKFRTGNLLEDSFPDTASDIHNMDLILCRNVFIYFNTVSVAIVLEKFSETLNEGGWLMTGPSELYGQSLGKLQARMFPESVVYQKTSAERYVKEGEITEVEKLRSFEVKGEKFSSSQLPGFSTSKVEIPILPIDTPSFPTPDSELETHLSMAQRCADSGEYDKAADLCRKALDIDNTAVRPYFLLAHIAEMKGNSEEAMGLLKKAIYLDPAFVAAWLELGALYERENDAERAKRMRTTAIELLKALPSESAIESYKEITAGGLLEYVKKMV